MVTAYVGLIHGLAAPKNVASPQFRNDGGLKEIRIGVREFECIGETPPEDHPHIYLEMGNRQQVSCPYCNTMYSFDSSLQKLQALPQASLFRGH